MTLETLERTPDFSSINHLVVHALAPLSMVSKMPGKYYRCQPAPTNEMLYGLLENALGWHIAVPEREQVLKRLEKRLGKTTSVSGVGFRSLLQYHVRIGTAILPTVTHYHDLWSQHLHGDSFVNGSREHGYEAIPLMNALAEKRIQVNDRAEAIKDPNALTNFQDGQIVHISVLRPYFPQYYISPTLREYIIADAPYQYRIETSAEMAKLLASAVVDPSAPLYLGTNDGWVDVEWKTLS